MTRLPMKDLHASDGESMVLHNNEHTCQTTRHQNP